MTNPRDVKLCLFQRIPRRGRVFAKFVRERTHDASDFSKFGLVWLPTWFAQQAQLDWVQFRGDEYGSERRPLKLACGVIRDN